MHVHIAPPKTGSDMYTVSLIFSITCIIQILIPLPDFLVRDWYFESIPEVEIAPRQSFGAGLQLGIYLEKRPYHKFKGKMR